jgi:hypothetical protein
MLKTFTLAVASVLALSLVSPEPADAQQQRSVRVKKERKVAHTATRSASVGANGLCQRDNGTPDDKLNFRNRCDVEEYWQRVNDRGSQGSAF